MRRLSLARLPKPRRKNWWENLDAQKHDRFYKEASKVVRQAPLLYRETYELIIKYKLMDKVLRLQRNFRRKSY